MLPDPEREAIIATAQNIARYLLDVRGYELSVDVLKEMQGVGIRVNVKRRLTREKLFQDGIFRVFDKHRADLVAAALDGTVTPAELAALSRDLNTEIYLQLLNGALERAKELADDLSLDVDNDVVIRLLEKWASDKSRELTDGIIHTTQDRLESLYRAQVDLGQPLTPDQVSGLIDYTFGDARAETIAATELTRARSFALQIYQDKLQEMGLEAEIRWNSAEDELVCPICQPLDHTTEEVWGVQFPDGPPAHVSCRCEAILERPQAIEL